MRSQRRAATLVLVLPLLFGACRGADGDRATPVDIVEVEAIGCDRPQPRRGVGTVVADGVVLTAGHVVDGELRDLRVDGQPAAVVGMDAESDLALVAVTGHLDPTPSWRFGPPVDVDPGPVSVRTAHRTVDAHLNRALTLRVEDITAHSTTQRGAFEIDVVVDPGDSGAPVIDTDGHPIGVVVLRRSSVGVSYASRLPALSELLDEGRYQELRSDRLARSGRCP
jgi:S1-C subfamily serine protease